MATFLFVRVRVLNRIPYAVGDAVLMLELPSARDARAVVPVHDVVDM